MKNRLVEISVFAIMILMFITIGCAKTPEAKFKDYLSGLISILEEYKDKPDNPEVVKKIDSYIQENASDLDEIAKEMAEKIKQSGEKNVDEYIAEVFKNIHPLKPKFNDLESKFKSNVALTNSLNNVAKQLKPIEDSIQLIIGETSAPNASPETATKPVAAKETAKPIESAPAKTDLEKTPAEKTEVEKAANPAPNNPTEPAKDTKAAAPVAIDKNAKEAAPATNGVPKAENKPDAKTEKGQNNLK